MDGWCIIVEGNDGIREGAPVVVGVMVDTIIGIFVIVEFFVGIIDGNVVVVGEIDTVRDG